MTELTNSEYRMILTTVEEASRDAGATIVIRGAMWSPIFRAVEQIVAGRLAPIRALADEWEHRSQPGSIEWMYGEELHAALSADLTAPQPTSGIEGQDEGERAREARCRTCGAPESNHPYRHPFKVWQPGRREATP